MFGNRFGGNNHLYFDEGAGGSGADDEASKKKAAEEEAARKLEEEAKAKKAKDFDAWLEKQPDDVKALYAESTKGLKSALKKEREANEANSANLKRLADLEAAEKKREEDKLSAEEKAKRQLAEAAEKATKAETELKEERMRNAVILEATKLNFADPEDAFNLADLKSLKYGDDGKPTAETVTAALSELAKAKPYLVKTTETTKEKKKIGTPPTKEKVGGKASETEEPKYPIPHM